VLFYCEFCLGREISESNGWGGGGRGGANMCVWELP
jgi:hypothetical protein